MVCRTVIFAIYKIFCIGLNLKYLNCISNEQNIDENQNYSLKSEFKN